MPENKEAMSSSIAAALKAGSSAEKITITEISMSGCTAKLAFAVTRQQAVTLHLFGDKGNGGVDAYSPISAVIESVSVDKMQDKLAYDAKIVFNGAISANHGVVQAMQQLSQQQFQPAATNLDSKNSSLFVVPVTCHMCGQTQIPLRSLHRHTMALQTNIFGIQQYAAALPGKEFCNFNLIRVIVCPSCYFASSHASDFLKESTPAKSTTEPFNKELIVSEWLANIAERKRLIEPVIDGFFGEERTLEQALLSYDLALITSDALLKAEQERKESARNYGVAFKGAYYLMIKAELLMADKKSSEAESMLKNALIKLNKIFPYLRREASIKAGFLMGMLGLYFGVSKIVGQSLTFLQQYNQKNKVKFGTDEQKALGKCLKKLSEAYQSRSEFSRKNLKGFNKPFEF